MDTQEETIYIAVLIIVLLQGLLLLAFGASLALQRRRYFKLKDRLIVAQTTVEERERERISDDLHDVLGTLLVLTRQALALVRPADGPSAEQLQKGNQLLEIAQERVRGIAQNLRPLLINMLGLEGSLGLLLDALPPDFYQKVRLQYQVHSKLDETVALHVFRMVQELLQNALKHAHCRRLLLQVKEEKGFLRIHYMDDGVGFIHEPYKPPAGQGLYSLQSRVERLGGTLTLKTAPKEGTQYFLEIPLKVTV